MKTRSMWLACAVSLFVLVFCVSAVAQIEIPQAQLTSSFSYLNTAKHSINQRGFELSTGWNWTRWLTLGADFCHYAGGGNELTDRFQFVGYYRCSRQLQHLHRRGRHEIPAAQE